MAALVTASCNTSAVLLVINLHPCFFVPIMQCLLTGCGPLPPGIILKRQAKPSGTSAGRKPKDLAALADAVQKLCQVALPLARSLEFLQEDVDSMSKEYR